MLGQHVLNQVEKWAQQTKDHLRKKCTDFLERKSLDKNLMMNYLDDLVMEVCEKLCFMKFCCIVDGHVIVFCLKE